MKIDSLLVYNSHWDGREFPRSQYSLKRKVFAQAAATLSSRLIVLICGLRRVGKSVLAGQLLEEAAQKLNISSPLSILTYTFENEDLPDLLPASALDDLLDLYFRNILKIHPQKIHSPVLIYLDEIQNVQNWQSVIKKYYDLNDKLKFIITGSSSLFLSESSESLAGRAIELEIPCLDFEEFLAFLNSPQGINLSINLGIKQAGSGHEFAMPVPTLITQQHQELFDAFLLCGAFPDSTLMFRDGVPIKDCQRFIRESIIKKVLMRDLKRYYRVQNTHHDVRLYEVCCRDTGSFMEIANMSREVGLSAASIKRHLDIFHQSGLICSIPKYDRKLRRQIRSSSKIYTASPSLAYAMLLEDSTKDSDFTGHMVESYVLQRLRTLDEKIYVDSTHGQAEVDFYLPHLKYLIESKYANRVDPRMFTYMKDRARKTNCSALVITKDKWDSGELSMLPAMFL